MLEHKEIVRNEYRVTCDYCPNRIILLSTNETKAVEIARQMDYHRVERWNGIEYIHRYLCPECFANHEGLGIDITWIITF